MHASERRVPGNAGSELTTHNRIAIRRTPERPDNAGARAERSAQLAEFLQTRRHRLTPEDVGLPRGARRRTPGLRREEVAQLAGMGIAWYTALEQGRAVRVSDELLGRLAHALRLDEQERTHLTRLARGCATPVPEPPPHEAVTPAMRRMLESLNPNPAYVMNAVWNVLAANTAQAALTPGLLTARVCTAPEGLPNVLCFVLTDEVWQQQVCDWRRHAREAVAAFRESVADDPDDPRVLALVADLHGRSAEFRRWWPKHELWGKLHQLPQSHEHPAIGRILLDNTLLQLRGAPRLTLVLHTARDRESREHMQALLRCP